MKRNKLVSTLLAVTLLSTMGLGTLVYGETITDKKNELADVKAQQKEAAGSVEEIKAQLEEQEKEVEKLEKEVSTLEGEISKKEAEVAETKVRMDERKDGLDERLRAMYKNGSVGFVDVLLSSKDVKELISNLEMIKKIYAYDQETLNQLQKDHEFLKNAEKDLKTQKANLVEKQSEATAKASKLEDERSAAQVKLDSLVAVSQDIENDIAAMQAKIDAENAAKANQIASNTSANTGSPASPGAPAPSGPVVGTGQYAWPTQGVITSPFGYRPNLYGNWHTGIDIANGSGTPIYAADTGTVTVATYVAQGYGNYIAIYHGNGQETRYGHLSGFAVSPGQTVTRGQLIGYMGSTGWSTGPHLHFEIRLNGVAVDPMPYL